MAHNPEVRGAVLAALLSGSSIGEISRRMKIPEPTITRWRDQAGIGPKAPPPPKTLDPKKGADLGELVAEYLNDVLVTLSAQARQFRDPEWLAQQSAADVAVLHGVLNDKAVRILGAIQADGPIPLPDSAPPSLPETVVPE